FLRALDQLLFFGAFADKYKMDPGNMLQLCCAIQHAVQRMRDAMRPDIKHYEAIVQAQLLPGFNDSWLRTPEIDVGAVWDCDHFVGWQTAVDHILTECFSNDHDLRRPSVKTHLAMFEQSNQLKVLYDPQLGKDRVP